MQQLIYKTENGCRKLMITRGYRGEGYIGGWTLAYTHCYTKTDRVGSGNPLRYSCLKSPMDRGAWQAHGFAKSWTGLKQFSIHKMCSYNLLYSTGNSTQHCVMVYMTKEQVDMCITHSLCYTPETNTTL